MEKYKLKPVNLKVKDACKVKKVELKPYQVSVGEYMKKHDNLILYHSVGSGKTATIINIIKETSKREDIDILLIIKASLHQGWLQEMKKWLTPQEQKKIIPRTTLIHYDSTNSGKEFVEYHKKKLGRVLYIIDEAHNFVNNILSNEKIKKYEGRAYTIYEEIIRLRKTRDDKMKMILMTGTPLLNEPYELSMMMNLIKPGILPINKLEFYDEYIENRNNKLEIKNKSKLEKILKGYISYYYGQSIPNLYAKKITKNRTCIMSEYQTEIYNYYKNLEVSNPIKYDHYKVYSRQASIFVFPKINKQINGYTRPRPSKYGGETPEFAAMISKFINGFDKYIEELNEKDKKDKHTLRDDIKETLNYDEIVEKIEKKKASRVLTALYNSSCKFVCSILNMLKTDGPTLFYTTFTWIEGMGLLLIYLKYFGYTMYNNETKDMKKYDYKRVVVYYGMMPKKVRDENINIFNRTTNYKGKEAKIIILSSAGSEGISLMNVKSIHIIDPYWHNIRKQQTEARGVRLCGHKLLPVEDRRVNVYNYYAATEQNIKNKTLSTDLYMKHKADTKEELNDKFLMLMKEISIDCKNNKEHTKFDKKNKDMKCKK